ncbi:hypothetical protein [Streptomyces sp. NBC_00690]|uniref:hypothetical protein n=1 Tax=Streptomyces sp. NBC_00690 TaxID=2975808 RepID=UPI002E284BBD|nr:hypothetical protein [Streptomyces sp. NBC_00690]
MNGYAIQLMWGVVTLIGGGLLAANVRGAADWFQAMSYAYRSWPTSAITCRVMGGVLALIGAGTLLSAGR